MTDIEKRQLIQRLHSEVRNSEDNKTEYKGYIILNKPYRYWIGTETNGEFVFHISVITMAQVIDWIETSIKIIESRNK